MTGMKIKQILPVFGIYLAWTFFILFAGHVLFRSYDISDTSFLIYHDELVSGHGLFATMAKWASFNIKPRLAPFYAINGVLLAKIFGIDFAARSVYYWLTFSLSLCFLFIFMRRMKFSWLLSFLFPLLFLVGRQSEIWWIDYGENTGILFLSLALVCITDGFGRQGLRRLLSDLLLTFPLF